MNICVTFCFLFWFGFGFFLSPDLQKSVSILEYFNLFILIYFAKSTLANCQLFKNKMIEFFI